MEDYDVRSAASILASVKEQEARFEQLTRALEEERRNVTLQLERANLPSNPPTSQPLAWQQVVIQVNDASTLAQPLLVFATSNLRYHVFASLTTSPKQHLPLLLLPSI
ncbi:Armadillo repeat protein deleted in velo-cardio-facial syndrome -like protein [Channa argus]|uniref:Armadillo repeat protein deleted in velo-cardio-facial syndrome-like protein n=1 Tax=Channa argus TaxID=215402 RepID=A0A6G1Q0Y1_CHAAH|nr:Armadillo repeat protein deleted in velo-cardio-facial syndrome -like protein [Channa argus]